MHMIDTHLHLLYPETLSYPWTAGTSLAQAFHWNDYQTVAKDSGIVYAIHMEVDVASAQSVAEVDLIESISQETPHSIRLAGQIASCRPEDNLCAAHLDVLQQRGTVKGVRRILHTSDDSLSHTTLFADNLRLLARYDYSFDLCVLARQLRPVALPLVQACPDVRFVLNHCGVPSIKGESENTFNEWKVAIKALSAHANVYCKLSGIVAYADSGWHVDTLRPYAEHVIQCFGWDRVVWGSDWPVCTLGGGLAAWIDATHALLVGCSEDEKARLLYRNAQTLYRLA